MDFVTHSPNNNTPVGLGHVFRVEVFRPRRPEARLQELALVNDPRSAIRFGHIVAHEGTREGQLLLTSFTGPKSSAVGS